MKHSSYLVTFREVLEVLGLNHVLILQVLLMLHFGHDFTDTTVCSVGH